MKGGVSNCSWNFHYMSVAYADPIHDGCHRPRNDVVLGRKEVFLLTKVFHVSMCVTRSDKVFWLSIDFKVSDQSDLKWWKPCHDHFMIKSFQDKIIECIKFKINNFDIWSYSARGYTFPYYYTTWRVVFEDWISILEKRSIESSVEVFGDPIVAKAISAWIAVERRFANFKMALSCHKSFSDSFIALPFRRLIKSVQNLIRFSYANIRNFSKQMSFIAFARGSGDCSSAHENELKIFSYAQLTFNTWQWVGWRRRKFMRCKELKCRGIQMGLVWQKGRLILMFSLHWTFQIKSLCMLSGASSCWG